MSDAHEPDPGPHGRTPHDLLLRGIFVVPDQAMSLLRLALPEELAGRIDPATVRLDVDWFVDEAGWTASDLLFELQLSGRPTLVYVLLEHQSTVRRWLLLRLPRQVQRIWTRWRRRLPRERRRGALLPPVLPLIIYQGRRWTAPRRLGQLIDMRFPPEVASVLARHQLEHEPVIHQLGAHDLVDLLRLLTGPAIARLAIVALWAGREGRDMLEAWDQAGALVPEAQREDTEQFLEIFRYVGRLLGDETAMKVRSAMIRKHGDGVHPSWIAYEEALRAKGQAEGQAKGQAEGQRAVLRVILERRLRGAASEILERLTSADEDQVLRLAELLGTDLADQELRSAIEALLPRRK